MLSISPMADGTIPDEQKHILAEIGNWLKINGEGIYGTRKWKIETEGPVDKLIYDAGNKTMWDFANKCDENDIRFTKKDNRLFAFILDWPEDRKAVIKSLGTNTKTSSGGIADIRMLGHKDKLKWTRNKQGLTVNLPNQKPCNYAFGLEIIVQNQLLN